MRTVGAFGSTDAAIESGVGSPSGVAPISMKSGAPPGENPSRSWKSAPSMGVVPWSGGSVLPPNVTLPSTSHTFDGNGSPQWPGTMGSQSAPSSGRPPVGSTGGGDSEATDDEHPTARTRPRKSALVLKARGP